MSIAYSTDVSVFVDACRAAGIDPDHVVGIDATSWGWLIHLANGRQYRLFPAGHVPAMCSPACG